MLGHPHYVPFLNIDSVHGQQCHSTSLTAPCSYKLQVRTVSHQPTRALNSHPVNPDHHSFDWMLLMDPLGVSFAGLRVIFAGEDTVSSAEQLSIVI